MNFSCKISYYTEFLVEYIAVRVKFLGTARFFKTTTLNQLRNKTSNFQDLKQCVSFQEFSCKSSTANRVEASSITCIIESFSRFILDLMSVVKNCSQSRMKIELKLSNNRFCGLLFLSSL